MSTHQHRRYSTEFKLQVMKAYLDGEGSLKAPTAVANTHRDRTESA